MTTIASEEQQQQQAAVTASTISEANPIRHAGRALVRGKYRRVWRPRYLEVRDNGLLSYYECPVHTPSSSALDVFVDPSSMTDSELMMEQTNDHHHHHQDDLLQYHSKIPKCTLWIHHARVIDPTTLRDMHVGLPRGAYGFLFHAHRIDDDDPEGDLLQDGLQLLSMGQACQGNTTDATPRDFLCAVDSLEEAQSWVVALQWAASMGRDSSFHGGTATLPYTLPTTSSRGIPNDVVWDHHQHQEDLSVSSSFASTSQRQAQNSNSNSNSDKEAVPSPSRSNKQLKASSPAAKKRSSSAGKMVVTKVVGYKLVRVETWKWEIAYQIQVLLVMPTKEQRQVQEWSILRTAQNLELIVEKLKVSLPDATVQKLTPQIERIGPLPKLQQQSSSTRRAVPLTELSKSVAVVDSILRSFCMEATVVNSSVVKRFLGVHPSASQTVTEKSPFWQMHNSTGLQTRPKRTILHQSIDQYVKQWLQKPKEANLSPSLNFRLLCWYLRLPQPATTYAGVLLMTLWLSASTLPTVNRFIRKFQILPFVTMRLDALILSWCIAAGLGRLLAGTSPTTLSVAAPKSGTSSHPTPTKKQLPPTTTVASASPQASPTKLRVTATPNKSLMDDEDSQDGMATEEDGEEEGGINETADSPSEQLVVVDEETKTTPFLQKQDSHLSSPLPEYSTADNITQSCWSTPKDHIFHVRGPNYLTDRVKIPSGDASFTCLGVDMWMTDNPERHIARHPSVMGGQLAHTDQDIFLVNFLLPFGNFVSYFAVPPLEKFANPQLAGVWTRFIQGDQSYRDARLKLLPVVVDGPWIVRAAVPGTSPALLGKVIPLQYFFTHKANGRTIYEVDVIITASSIAKGILSVVKGHAKALSIAFAFIIEAAEEHELPETVLASIQVNSLHLEDCPLLPDCNLDAF